MKRIALALATFALGTAAHAAKITCEGQYSNYQVHIQAKAQNHQVVGNIQILVMNGKEVLRKTNLPPTSSDVQVGKHIQCSGQNSEAAGHINAAFDRRTGLYNGILHVEAALGSADVPMSCSLTGTSIFDNGFEVFDLEDYM